MRLVWAGFKDAAGGIADGGVQIGVDVIVAGGVGALQPVAGIAVGAAAVIDSFINLACDVRNMVRSYRGTTGAMEGCKCPTE